MTGVATSATSITVMWEEVPPIDQNGVITVYEVRYLFLLPSESSYRRQTFNVTEQMTVLENLEENVEYLFNVRAYTSTGAGNYTSGVLSWTLEDGNHFFVENCYDGGLAERVRMCERSHSQVIKIEICDILHEVRHCACANTIAITTTCSSYTFCSSLVAVKPPKNCVGFETGSQNSINTSYSFSYSSAS